MIECQVDHFVRQIQAADTAGAQVIELEGKVAEAFDKKLTHDIAAVSIWQCGCANYYSTASGRNVTQWPGSMIAYRERTL